MAVFAAVWLAVHVTGFWYLLRYEWQGRLKKYGRWHRWERLNRIIRYPQIEQVLPHRVCEHRMLKPKRPLKSYPPGTTIVINGPRLGSNDRPHPISVPFEPQEIGGSMDALFFALSKELTPSPVGVEDMISRGLQSFGAPSPGRSTRLIVGVALLVLLFSGYVLGAVFIGGQHWAHLFVLAVPVLLLLARREQGRNWWIVPGGLLFRRHWPWRRKTKVGMATPENATLVINPGAGTAVIGMQGSARLLHFPPRAGLCLLAAWTSRVVPPTKEEILAFFGSDAEWDE